MVASGDADPSPLKDIFWDTESTPGPAAFMDRSAGLALTQKMKEDPEFFNIMTAEMEKTYRHTWSWLNMKFGEANLIAFS